MNESRPRLISERTAHRFGQLPTTRADLRPASPDRWRQSPLRSPER
jgi:hypothetical protein